MVKREAVARDIYLLPLQYCHYAGTESRGFYDADDALEETMRLQTLSQPSTYPFG